jgi:hypothetical protein
MALKVKEKGGDFKPAPAGNHLARCIGVVDLGTQYSPRFDKASKKLRISWELPNETHVFNPDKGPEPFVVGREFTASLNKNSALRPLLESWRGRAFTAAELEGFELKKLIGAPCLINIVHETVEGKTYANIASVSQLVKGTQMPPQQLAGHYYEIEQGRDEAFNNLPEWLQEKIEGCEEWKKPTPAPDALPATDDIGEGFPDVDDTGTPF